MISNHLQYLDTVKNILKALSSEIDPAEIRLIR